MTTFVKDFFAYDDFHFLTFTMGPWNLKFDFRSKRRPQIKKWRKETPFRNQYFIKIHPWRINWALFPILPGLMTCPNVCSTWYIFSEYVIEILSCLKKISKIFKRRYLEFTLQDEDFEYCLISVWPPILNLKNYHGSKKALGGRLK